MTEALLRLFIWARPYIATGESVPDIVFSVDGETVTLNANMPDSAAKGDVWASDVNTFFVCNTEYASGDGTSDDWTATPGNLNA